MHQNQGTCDASLRTRIEKRTAPHHVILHPSSNEGRWFVMQGHENTMAYTDEAGVILQLHVRKSGLIYMPSSGVVKQENSLHHPGRPTHGHKKDLLSSGNRTNRFKFCS